MIPREKSIEYSASEFGLERFARLDIEADLIGKQGLFGWQERGYSWRINDSLAPSLVEIGMHETGTELE